MLSNLFLKILPFMR